MPLVPVNDPYFKEMLAHGQHAGALTPPRTRTAASTTGCRARRERHQRTRGHLVRGRAGGHDVRRFRRPMWGCSSSSIRIDAKNEPVLTPLLAGARRPAAAGAAAADHAVGGPEEVPGRRRPPPAQLRLGRQERGRRAHSDRQGEGAAAAEGIAGPPGAGRPERRHARGRERRSDPADGTFQRPRPTSVAGRGAANDRRRRPPAAGATARRPGGGL